VTYLGNEGLPRILTGTDGLQLPDVLRGLAKQRPLFHSEADFKHALAWEIQGRFPHAEVRLEVPLSDRRERLDMLVRVDGTTYALELKYKTRGITFELAGEKIQVRDQGAPDTGRYDFLKDLGRLERFVAQGL